MLGNRKQSVLLHALAFRAPEMRGQNHSGPGIGGELDCGKRSADASVIVNFPAFDGNVEINSDKNSFLPQLEILD